MIQNNDFAKFEFNTEGTYFYSDVDNDQLKGTITILGDQESQDQVSKPLQGIENIISSLGSLGP